MRVKPGPNGVGGSSPRFTYSSAATIRSAARPSPYGFGALDMAAYPRPDRRAGDPGPRRCGPDWSDEPEGSSLHTLDPLGALAHDEDRLPERRRLLLDTTRVGDDDVAPRDQPGDRRIVERAAAGRSRGRRGWRQPCTDARVRVEWEDEADVGVPLDRTAHTCRDRARPPPQFSRRWAVTSIMRRSSRRPPRPRDRESDTTRPAPTQRVDPGVAGDVDPAGRNPLATRCPRSARSARNERSRYTRSAPVDLLRERREVQVVRPKSRLDVPDRDPEVERRERGRERGAGIAVDEHGGGIVPAEDLLLVACSPLRSA